MRRAAIMLPLIIVALFNLIGATAHAEGGPPPQTPRRRGRHHRGAPGWARSDRCSRLSAARSSS